LKSSGPGYRNRISRLIEYCFAIFKIKKIIRMREPDMVIAERTTSYGFLAALCGVKPFAIAQQGITDLWPENSLLFPLKKAIQNYAFQKATLIHAWGLAMTYSMKKANVDMNKVLILPKGIDMTLFDNANNSTTNTNTIHAIVTRSLLPEYRHNIIIKAFGILNEKGIDFTLTIVGDGSELAILKALTKKLKIEDKVHFTGRIPNNTLPELLQQSNFYISMPITEGVSSSLFEAMATYCYPIVTDIPGNQSWITHRENGNLIPIDDKDMLANELLWALENQDYRMQALVKNRKFVEEKANYNINMKIIADRYHELITQFKTN
jgi:glycosyltransferase involved in cell wall biosynthesis